MQNIINENNLFVANGLEGLNANILTKSVASQTNIDQIPFTR